MSLKDKSTIISSTQNVNNKVIQTLTKAIKDISSEFNKYLDVDYNNYKEIEEFLITASTLIDDCDITEKFKCNRSSDFLILVYKYQRLSLKYETWKTNQKLNEAVEKQKRIEDNQEKMEKKNNNMVYNILAFIASFSIVSASVTAFEKVSSVEDILIFMVFTAFIIVTTLIALDNFYRSNNERGNKLKNNYFLWKVLLVVIFLLLGYKSVNYLKNNQEEIFESFGRGVESVRIEYENK